MNPIFDNLGITIDLTEMPEHKEYAEYYLNRNQLVRWYLLTFKRVKVQELKFKFQCTLLNATLEKGKELIDARHTEPR